MLIRLVTLVYFIVLSSASIILPNAAEASVNEVDLCPPCVTFAEENLADLYSIVTGKIVPKNCNDLCEVMNDSLSQQVCLFLCLDSGISTFIADIKKADPDSIYFCEILNVCPVANGGLANITNTYVIPSTGSLGTSFKIQLIINVTQATGTGQIAISVKPPAGSIQPFSQYYLNEGFDIGSYSAKFEIQTNSSYPIGNYTASLQVCSGTCGGNNPNEAILATKNVGFAIK